MAQIDHANHAIGIMLVCILGENMKTTNSTRGLLKQLQTELKADSLGFVELFPTSQRLYIQRSLNRSYAVTDSQSLKEFVKDHIRAGYALHRNGIVKDDRVIVLPEIGKDFARYLLGIGYR